MVAKHELPQNNPSAALELADLDRAPFIAELSDWLKQKPNRKALQKFADRFPDRWVGGVSALARLVGYADKHETTHNINVNLAVRLQGARSRDAVVIDATTPLPIAAPIADSAPDYATTLTQPASVVADTTVEFDASAPVTYTEDRHNDETPNHERAPQPIPLTTADNNGERK